MTPGTLFFCVPGFTRDGHDFAADAIARGAVALVVAAPARASACPRSSSTTCAPRWRPPPRALAGDPTARLTTVGITGTNGKTTSAFLVRALLEAGGRRDRPARHGDRDRRRRASTPSARTTPEAIDLQRTFAEMLAAGDDAVVMEVSSHALALHRADAIHWAAARLHQPHPGPPRLPRRHGGLLPGQAPAVRGRARARGRQRRRPLRRAPGRASFPRGRSASASTRPTRRCARPRSRATRSGSSFAVDGLALRTTLPGRFNVLNALGAVVVARELGVDDAAIARGAGRRPSACPGRFEPVDEGQPFAVFVDYSHKPDSLENVLRAARGLTRGPADRRLRRRRRPRPRQAPADGARGAPSSPTSRSSPPTTRATRTPRRSSPQIAEGGGRTASSASSIAARRSSAPSRWPRRATSSSSPARATSGPGVRGRPHGALRRRRRRPRGAACARGRLSRSRRPPAARLVAPAPRRPAGPRAR